MTAEKLEQQIRLKKSFLCVGLDTDPKRIPEALRGSADPVFAFNKAIIDATHSYCVAYKPNTAFYEALGVPGWMALEKTLRYLREQYPDHFTIADAKRGDIGNTATQYARAFFETLQCDAVTVAPYMGRDSIEPFLEFENHFAILLALTSNPGAFDFQTQKLKEEELYLEVLRKSLEYRNSDRLMYVVGATKAEYLREIRKIVPNHFLLVPGVGAQGGSLVEVCKYGMNSNVGLLVNSSRGIQYASEGDNFARAAAQSAATLQQEMASLLTT